MAFLLELDKWTPGNVLTVILIVLLFLGLAGAFDK